jgi:GT2 family glycosyltransferase
VSAPEVSIIVCVHNGARNLPHLFEALSRQTLAPERYEVIVVDDASTDDTVDVVERAGYHPVRAREQVGLPRARNLGIAQAKAPVLAFTDDDTVPAPDWLERGVERMSADGVDMLAGGIELPLGSDPGIIALLDASAHFHQEDYVTRGFGAGANLWAKTDLTRSIGGFNDRLAAYGGDDNDFCQRAIDAGARLVYAPEVSLQHPPRQTARVLARKRYLLGYGLAAHRRYSAGSMSHTPKLFVQRGSYRPRNMVNFERLRRMGHEPRGARRVALQVMGWILLQLPRVYGDLRGEMAFRRHDGARGTA